MARSSPEPGRPQRQLVAIDLFAGAGGMSLGLAQADFQVLTAVERDPQAASTYLLNHPRTRVLIADAAEIDDRQLLQDRRRRIDLVAGGPPCQGFSIKGQRRPDHPGNAMLGHFVRIVASLRPRAVLIENVVGLTSMLRGYYFDRLITSLERIDLGSGRRYDVEFAILNAADYGVPQNRRRLFIVATEPGRLWQWPKPTTPPEELTLWDAIGDLPPESESPGVIASYIEREATSPYARRLGGGSKVVLNHHTKRLEHLRLQRLDALEEGQDRRHLPEHLQAGGHETKYRRLRADAVAPTMTAHMGKDLSDFIHPQLPRTLTVREAARVQGFPDTYEFLGSQASQFTQVGNAVPVPLAHELGVQIVRLLRGPRP